MAHATDKRIYAYAKLMFEAENPGRSFDHGPVIRSAGLPRPPRFAGEDERDGYVDRARRAFERPHRPERREHVVGDPVR